MESKEYITYTLKNMKARKMRAWLTTLGIIIGIAAIVGMITISQSMTFAVEEQFEKMGISSIRVVPADLNGPPDGALGLPLDLREDIEDVIGVEYVDAVLVDFGTVEYGKEEEPMSVTSYDTTLNEEGFLDTDLKTERGRLFKSGEKGSAVIGYGVAYDTYDKDISVKNTIAINQKDFKVIGILENSGTDVDDRIFIGLEDAQVLFNKPDIANVFVVQTGAGLDTKKIGEKIQEKLEKSLDEDEFKVYTPEQLLKQIGAILGVIQIVLASIASISLLVGAVGIMNSMFTAVLERTREIGVMKAIGATNRSIMSIFLIEAGCMGMVGGIIGTAIGTILAFLVEIGARAAGYGLFSVRVEPSLVISAIFFAFIIGALAGAIPAYRAAKMSPVIALRYE